MQIEIKPEQDDDGKTVFFDAEWRKACAVRQCSVTEVDDFVKAHYLRKRPAIVLLCLMMMRDGRPVGCIIYSAPPREADKRYGGKTWELARLYLLDEVPKNAETWLIAQSVRAQIAALRLRGRPHGKEIRAQGKHARRRCCDANPARLEMALHAQSLAQRSGSGTPGRR